MPNYPSKFPKPRLKHSLVVTDRAMMTVNPRIVQQHGNFTKGIVSLYNIPIYMILKEMEHNFRVCLLHESTFP